MPLTAVFGTRVAQDKAERIATAVTSATGFGAKVQSRGMGILSPKLYDIVVETLNPTTGEKENPTITADDGGAYTIPDAILKLVREAGTMDALKKALKDQGALNGANINAAGGGRRKSKTAKKSKSKSKSPKASKKSKKSAKKSKKSSKKSKSSKKH